MKSVSFFGIALLCLFNLSALAQLSITWPVDHAVFQRNGSDNASFYMAGQFVGCPIAYNHLEMRLERLDKYGNYQYVQQDWTTVGRDQDSNTPTGQFWAYVTLPKGWYRLIVKAVDNWGGLVSQNDLKVGVGDVYIIAGQSNAQGIIDQNLVLPSETPYDCVVANTYQIACDYPQPSGPGSGFVPYPRFPAFQPLQIKNDIAPSGYLNWCYTKLGDDLVDTYDVPVSFFNTASTGTDVLAWLNSAKGIAVNTTQGILWPCSSLGLPNNSGLPYRHLKHSLNYFASMFGVKSILWHQGEADTEHNTSQSDYYNRLSEVINISRSDFANNSLSWIISAPATYYNTNTNANVAAAQNQLTSYPSNNVGPSTDQYFGPTYRLSDNTHFSGQGLYMLAQEWKNHLPAGNAIASHDLAHINIQDYGNGTYTLYAQNGFAEYRWVGYNGDLDGPTVSTGSSISAYDGSIYRCYMKDFSGNWVLSPRVTLYNCNGNGGGSTRIGVPDTDELRLFAFKTYPNPSQDKLSAEFTLKQDAQVRLQLLDETGRMLNTLVEARHSAQQFTYPVPIQHLQKGVYFLQLKVDDMAVVKKIIKN